MARLVVSAIRVARGPAIDALSRSRRFEAPMPIEQIAALAEPFLAQGNQYGEGWFLAGEMAELLTTGVSNIVCIQPFACLPNHVVGKGVIKKLRAHYPDANIVAVDYDPGSSEANQLNRLKLMLAVAKKKAAQVHKPAEAAHSAAAQATAHERRSLSQKESARVLPRYEGDADAFFCVTGWQSGNSAWRFHSLRPRTISLRISLSLGKSPSSTHSPIRRQRMRRKYSCRG